MRTPKLTRTLAAILVMGGATTSHAATLLVTTAADSYDGLCNLHCSLRDAVAVANQAPSADTIVLLASTYTLTRPLAVDGNGVPIDDDDHQFGDLDVLGELRIRGLTTTASRIQGQFNDRLFEIRPGAKLTLEKLTLEGGNTAHNGGAVENHGQLRLSAVRVQHNQAMMAVQQPSEAVLDHGHGGGIANYGELTVLSSRLQENEAKGNTVSHDPGRGGAIFNLGDLLIRDSLLFRNIHALENPMGSALYNQGSAIMERSGIVANSGGELGFFTILNDGGELTLTNSTLSGNVAGGIGNQPNSKATLTNVTLTNTAGIGLRNFGDLTIYNSIIVGNLDDDGQPANCFNGGDTYSFQAVGLMLNEGPNSCSADYHVPLLDTFTQVLQFPITKQNDLIWFHALPPGSPAIDSGIGDCIAVDQRGAIRPQDGDGDGGAVCDLGAYELTP